MNAKVVTCSLFVIGIALAISGAMAYSSAHPSPHFYVELLEAVPRILLSAGVLLFTGLSLPLKGRLKQVSLGLAGLCAALGIVHWLFLFWVLVSDF